MKQQLGAYRLLRVLGRGGMGTVYEAHDPRLDRHVAVKQLSDHVSGDPNIKQRFLREARSAAGLNHANIVAVHAIEEADGADFIVMELVEGESLAALLKREGRLPAAHAAGILRDVTAGLAAAHDKGIIHRDIKPGNIMITKKGNVKLADFGIAATIGVGEKLTATGQLVGTPGYLSPESCRGEAVDHRADIFALGIVFYEMLSGVSPFQSDSPVDMIRKIAEARVPDIDSLVVLDDEPKEILAKMIQGEPGDRFADCHGLIDRLDAYLIARGDRKTVRATPPVVVKKSPAWKPFLLPLAAAVALVVAGLMIRQVVRSMPAGPDLEDKPATGRSSLQDARNGKAASSTADNGVAGDRLPDRNGLDSKPETPGSVHHPRQPARELPGENADINEDPDDIEGIELPKPEDVFGPEIAESDNGLHTPKVKSDPTAMARSPGRVEAIRQSGTSVAPIGSKAPVRKGPPRVALRIEAEDLSPFVEHKLWTFFDTNVYSPVKTPLPDGEVHTRRFLSTAAHHAEIVVQATVRAMSGRQVGAETMQEGWLHVEAWRAGELFGLGWNWVRPIEWNSMTRETAVSHALRGFQVHLNSRTGSDDIGAREAPVIAITGKGDWKFLSSVENLLAQKLEKRDIPILYGSQVGVATGDPIEELAERGAEYVIQLSAEQLPFDDSKSETLYQVVFSWRYYHVADKTWQPLNPKAMTIDFTRLNLKDLAEERAGSIYRKLKRGYNLF
ncbi:MAG: serine/threonine-protein kinase [Acidobacteriota bacterium]|nr:serine/threonine-protein kinase [Acidobacteriota bacterium]